MRANPYTDLLTRVKEFALKVRIPRTRVLWVYPKDEVDKGAAWAMDKLRERILAADQLGQDVVLTVDAGRVVVSYRERVNIPCSFQ